MNVVKLAQMAIQSGASFATEVGRIALSGELNRRHLWYGIEGAKEYVEAVASGDVADDQTIDYRRMKCSGCGSRCLDGAHPQRLGHCGPKFQDRTKEQEPTCGCPIEAATAVGSKVCPQGKW